MFSQLETDGYVVIPNFLSKEELAGFAEDYYTNLSTQQNNKENRNYAAVIGSVKPAEQKIKDLFTQISQTTNIDVDMLCPRATYWVPQFDFDTSSRWHQDHETYYKWQQAYTGLNLWIPISKPNKHLTGLELIPMSRLPQDIRNLIVNRGASLFFVENGGTRMVDNDQGTEVMLDIDLDSIKVTPEVGPGDLILLRWDTIHKSQDNIDRRLAVSIRGLSSQHTLTRNNFYTPSKTKMDMIKKDTSPSGYNKLIDLFKDKQTLTPLDISPEWKFR